MNSDFTNSMTFAELQLEVAIAFGWAAQGETGFTLSTDPVRLDMCRRAVNLGYRRVQSEKPKWDASVLLIQVRVTNDDSSDTIGTTIDGDYSRYALPRFIQSQPIGHWTVLDDSSDRSHVVAVDYKSVRRLHERQAASGAPHFAAVGRRLVVSPSNEGHPTYELIVYPTPDTTYTMEAQFRVQSDVLLEDDDRHIFGPLFDTVIRAAALMEASMLDTRPNPQLREQYKGEYAQALAAAFELDRQLGSPSRTYRGWDDPKMRNSGRRQRTQTPIVTQVNGVDIT